MVSPLRAARLRSNSLPTAPVAPVRKIDCSLISVLDNHAGPVRSVAEGEEQQIVSFFDASALGGAAEIEQIVGCDRMSDPRDVLGVDPIGWTSDQSAKYLPAAERNVVGDDESDVVHLQSRLRERPLDQRFRRREIRGDDLVLDLFAVPERALGNLCALDNSVPLAVAADERSTGTIGYQVVGEIAMTACRKLVSAHAQNGFQIVFRHYQCARQSERGEDRRAAELIDADN